MLAAALTQPRGELNHRNNLAENVQYFQLTFKWICYLNWLLQNEWLGAE